MDSLLVDNYCMSFENERFGVEYKTLGKFTITDKENSFPSILVESGKAKEICKWLNNNVISNEKHYLENFLLDGGDGTDVEIITEVKKRLPKDFIVNCDDTFLIIECENKDNYSNKEIAKAIDMPFESISFTTIKKCNGYDNKIVYFCWDKAIDEMGILD